MKIKITHREFNLIQNICKRDRSTLGAFQLLEIPFDDKVIMWVRNTKKTQSWILEQASKLPNSLFKQFERIEKELI